MLARVILTSSRKGAFVAYLANRQLVAQQHQFHTKRVIFTSLTRPIPLNKFARYYSNQSEKPTEETTKEKEENKEENNEEKEEKENKENEEEKKEDDTPIVEPAWRTSRAGTFQKQQPAEKEVKVSKTYTYLFIALALGGVGLACYEGYKTVSHAQRENSADPTLVYRRVLDEAIKSITENQKVIDKFFKVPSVVEESMVQCQAFGPVTSISFPLLQMNTAARVGTVYIDIVREADTYYLRSAYVDFVLGSTLDLVEAGIIKPDDYVFYLFAREFSVEESMRQMYEATQQMAQQQPPQQQPR